MPNAIPTKRATAPRLARFAAVLAALIIAPFGANAAAPVHLQWESLPTLVGKTVRLAMPGGTVMIGKAVGVEADALLVDVKSTSDPKAYPKGITHVPRATLRRFEMRKKGRAFRIVGTTLGSLAGLVGGVMAGWSIEGGIFGKSHDALAAAALFGIWAGGTTGGYFAGNALDKTWTPVEIMQ